MTHEFRSAMTYLLVALALVLATMTAAATLVGLMVFAHLGTTV
jgi:hypothetical protein